MRQWRRGRALAAWVCGGLVALSAPARPPAARALEGALTMERSGITQKARLVLFPYLRRVTDRPEETSAQYLAILSLGSGKEATSLYYRDVRYNPQTGEFLLAPDASAEGEGRLPMVRARFVSPHSVEGNVSFFSTAEVGRLRVALPKQSRLVKTLPPLEGIYRGDCETSLTETRLEYLELRPTRLGFPTGRAPAEATARGVNYIGYAGCRIAASSHSEPLTCASFATGYYSFFSGELSLVDGTHAVWQCQRDATGERLTCSGRTVKGCTLERQPEKTTMREATPAAKRETITTERESFRELSPDACSAWDGRYRGELQHADTGRVQEIAIDLEAWLSSGPQPPVRCLLRGVASLHFAGVPLSQRIPSVFPEFEIIPTRTDQALVPDREGDAILEITLVSSDRMEGQWYSKRYGYVGPFTATKSGEGPLFKGEPVHGIAAHYVEADPQRQHELQLSVIPVMGEGASANPFSPLSLVGWLDLKVTRLAVKAGAYDFFTNQLALDLDGIFLVGELDPNGFSYRVLTQRILSTPLGGKVYRYVRR